MRTKRWTRKKTILGLAGLSLLLFMSTARADGLAEQSHLFELGLYGGVFLPSSSHDLMDERNSTFSKLKDVALDVGARFAYLPMPIFGAELEGGIVPTAISSGGNALLYHLRAHLLLQYPARFAPFLVAGGGMMGVVSDKNVLGNDLDPELHWGVGLKAYLTNWLACRIDGRHIMSDGGTRTEKGVAHHFEVLAGLSVVLGWNDSPKDSDGDGITDDKDKCPHLRGNPPDGCPPKDTDGDGLTDDKDKCPDKYAKTPDGCPPEDTDGDGLTDDKDKCPTVPAKTVDGCPPKDTDGDGLTDDKDKCPTVPAKTPDGCPPKDTDGDGITDDKDKCPTEPETKNGYQDEDGCPDTVPKAVKKFTGAIRGIRFAVNKAVIRKTSYPTLNAAAKVLKDYPELKLSIRGHSDTSGKRPYNMSLSEKRAQAVKAYLVGKGIDGARLTAVGIGPDEPVADNKTAKGRAKNRRIEFKLGGN